MSVSFEVLRDVLRSTPRSRSTDPFPVHGTRLRYTVGDGQSIRVTLGGQSDDLSPESLVVCGIETGMTVGIRGSVGGVSVRETYRVDGPQSERFLSLLLGVSEGGDTDTDTDEVTTEVTETV